MNDPLEKKLHTLQDHVRLSATEKDFHRAQLEEVMRTRPVARPIPSPFISLMFGRPQMTFAMLALVIFGGGGAVSASDRALPGDTLYSVKLQLTEPARLALTFNTEERTELEAEYASRRLKEFALATVQGSLSEGDAKDITDSLDERIAGAQEGIERMKLEGEGEDAYLAQADLRTMLLTHSNILKKVASVTPGSELSVDDVQQHLHERLTDIAEEESVLTAIVENTEEDAGLDASVEGSRVEATAALRSLEHQVIESGLTLDAGDHVVIKSSLEHAGQLIRDAETKQGEGEGQTALQLFAEAEEIMDELSMLIESEQSLEIDLVGPATE